MTRAIASGLARNLARKATAATLAVALALTAATTAPARADGDKAAAIAAASFFALVTAGIIAAQRGQTQQHYTYREPPRVDRSRLLPAHCRFQLTYGRDRGTWYGSNCLRNSFAWARNLPAHCEELINTQRRQRDERAYNAQCLARYGYQAGAVRSGSRW